MVFFSLIFFYSFPINKGNILQLSPLVKRSHWQLCSEITIWDIHGLDWRNRGNSISAFTIILTFDITITGSMYKKSSFYQSVMWKLSSSWLDLKKVKLWLIEFPTAHRLMSLSLSGNVHSAYCQKDFQPYGCVFWAGLKDDFFTRLFNLIFLEKTLSKAQWTLCLTKFGQKFRPFLTRLHHVFVHVAQTVITYRCIAFKFYGCVGEVWTGQRTGA